MISMADFRYLVNSIFINFLKLRNLYLPRETVTVMFIFLIYICLVNICMVKIKGVYIFVFVFLYMIDKYSTTLIKHFNMNTI